MSKVKCVFVLENGEDIDTLNDIDMEYCEAPLGTGETILIEKPREMYKIVGIENQFRRYQSGLKMIMRIIICAQIDS